MSRTPGPDAAARSPSPVPVTLLTGFLGSGKTTLVNRLLTQAHGQRLAVIVNEFGEVGIDGALIARTSGPVVELANGCVCCATRGDLFGALNELMEAAAGPLDGIVIETSGLANPGPVIEDLERYQAARPIRFDSVVTVVDADNFDRNLDNAEVAFEQITLGDLLLVNKSDLVDAETLDAIERGLRRLNPRVPIARCVQCDVPIDLVTGAERVSSVAGTGAFEPHSHGPADPDHDHGHEHEHGHDAFDSIVLRCAVPLDAARFDRWLEALPAAAFRVKGFVRFADVAEAMVVHVVGARRSIEPAGADPGPGATLVVIGTLLDADALRTGLDACMAAAADAGGPEPSAP